MAAGAGNAGSALFRGMIFAVPLDNGGRFSGASTGDDFVGAFVYPDNGGAPTVLEPDEAAYEVGALVQLTGPADQASGGAMSLVIQDDQALDEEGADLINMLLNPVPMVVAGVPVDSWTVHGLESGAFELDPDLSDTDDTELLFNGVAFEFVLLSTDNALFNNLDYRPIPPALAQADLAVFAIREGDAAGNLIFEAFGLIEQLDEEQLFVGNFEA